ncbi:MAG: SpoIIIAH-like family protein [Clostridiales bacterium]|nr:SpoIIIAH-like family protein [Clostridiales bacterium]
MKKKEIIAASLVVLIGMAGYLNWSYQDTVRVKDNESYVTTGKTLGEAEMVSANNEVTEENNDSADAEAADAEETDESGDVEDTDNGVTQGTGYFEDAKMNRESARASAMESLKATASDEKIDEKTRALAGEKLVEAAADIEKENRIESIAKAKGFPDLCAYVNDSTAAITVRSDGLTEAQIVKLKDIVTSGSDISADRIKIIQVK